PLRHGGPRARRDHRPRDRPRPREPPRRQGRPPRPRGRGSRVRPAQDPALVASRGGPMLVSDVMTRQVVAIGPDTPIRDVQALMEQRNIRHFPILEARASPGQPDALVGIVSDRDVRLVGADHPKAPPDVRSSDPISRLMVTKVVTAHPGDPIQETAKAMRTRKIGAMPVMDDGSLVGIVTAADLLDALVSMSGVEQATSRLEVEIANRPGALAELLGVIA